MSENSQDQGRRRRRPTRRRRGKSIAPPLSIASHFRRLAAEEIEIEANGKRVRMSRWDAYINQVYIMALNKDIGATRLLEKLRKQFPGEKLPGEIITFHLSEVDMRL
ncbi:hypothetical protein AB8Z38_15625 [Bradyrhizobium sp. LLZ17]|uniref:DUF5681 domain-containing protein n=1 Tax=Bradyrhizobium sp. LLZ17 TaxID=3239388 RepID=A0AB39XRR1_9BRAD